VWPQVPHRAEGVNDMESTRRTEDRGEVGRTLEDVALLVVRCLVDRQGLAFTTIFVLIILDSEGPTRLTALAAAEGISQPSMSQLVQRMERQGLIVRLSDPDDGRAALIGITDTGRALIAERERARRDRLADLLATLSAEDEAALTLAMRVAQPIVDRLIRSAAQAGSRAESRTRPGTASRIRPLHPAP
jgi:DNA-binding MarR family transcriptional regulator